ncbi:MAG: hypothetical protein Q7T33_02350 [Dehalococcoidia bacterium]|nr:hypothetical protein [Dehalococcoidia bacterium]
MKRKRLEEILEECLTAYFEGRRSIEESLSQYPSLADRLAPLLLTAASVADNFQDYSLPAHLQERGLLRFLAAARTRASARVLTRNLQQQTLAASWGKRHWGFLGGAVAAALGVVLVTGVVLSNGGGGGGGDGLALKQTPVPTAVQTAPLVSSLSAQVGALKQRVSQGGAVETSELVRITEIVSQLGSSSLDDASRAELKETVQDTFDILNAIAAGKPLEDQTPEVRDAYIATRDLAGKVGATEFTPPAVTEPAGPTPAATETPAVTPTPAATPAPSPAPSPTPAATPAEASAPTPEARSVGPNDSIPLPAPANIDPLATPAQ